MQRAKKDRNYIYYYNELQILIGGARQNTFFLTINEEYWETVDLIALQYFNYRTIREQKLWSKFMEDSVANFVFIHSRKFMFSKYSKRVICKVSYNLSDFEVLVYRLVAFSSLTCNFTKIFTLPQVFFTHFASRNQLPGFSAISGTLIETDFFFLFLNFYSVSKIYKLEVN